MARLGIAHPWQTAPVVGGKRPRSRRARNGAIDAKPTLDDLTLAPDLTGFRRPPSFSERLCWAMLLAEALVRPNPWPLGTTVDGA